MQRISFERELSSSVEKNGVWSIEKRILIHAALLYIIPQKSCMKPNFLLLFIIGFLKEENETGMWSHNYPINLFNKC